MTENQQTPCGALFAVMKKQGGMSYKQLASLILSGKPLADGRSPASRVDDRTWVSRFIVHAPVGSLQERYFCDFGTAALRIIARLKAREKKAMASEQILGSIVGEGGQVMEQALAAAHQDVTLYRNVLERLIGGIGYTDDERVEIAMTLFVAVGCTGNVRSAATYAVEYARSIHGDNLATTPASTLGSKAQGPTVPNPDFALGLVRVVDGYVKGSAHWVLSEGEGVEIGALALGDNDIADVGPCVSGRHAHVWRDGDGHWYVEDLGSRNGTVVIDGLSRKKTVVAPPQGETDKDEGAGAVPDSEDAEAVQSEAAIDGPSDAEKRIDAELTVSEAVEIHPGDELVLGGDTVFALIAGAPE